MPDHDHDWREVGSGLYYCVECGARYGSEANKQGGKGDGSSA
jgi:hypothetical protein